MSYKYVGKHGSAVALRMGYKECPDENAYEDAYYIKDGLKWIFNITGLKNGWVFTVTMIFVNRIMMWIPIIVLKMSQKKAQTMKCGRYMII